MRGWLAAVPSGQWPWIVSDLFARMPKAELHLHLDGSLRPATALELARRRGLDAGMDLVGLSASLRAPAHAGNQAQLLKAFELPIALLQDSDALERATFELVEDVAAEGTRYVEIRWGPALHLRRGLSLRGSIEAVVAGARRGSAATGTVVRLIAVAIRSHDPDVSEQVALESVRYFADGLTGFDLAGPEEDFPDPLAHARAFHVARQGGLGITVHAGEWGGPRQVMQALAIKPDRIAHGSRASDQPSLMAELRSQDVVLDLCPTSNVQASIYRTAGRIPAAPPAQRECAGHPLDRQPDGIQPDPDARIPAREFRPRRHRQPAVADEHACPARGIPAR